MTNKSTGFLKIPVEERNELCKREGAGTRCLTGGRAEHCRDWHSVPVIHWWQTGYFPSV